MRRGGGRGRGRGGGGGGGGIVNAHIVDVVVLYLPAYIKGMSNNSFNTGFSG